MTIERLDPTKSKRPPPDTNEIHTQLVPTEAPGNQKDSYHSRLPELSVEELDGLRRRALATVKDNIPRVRAVLAGDLRWTNQQIKLFQIVLNKVLPDLSASQTTHIHKKDYKSMSREELEAFVALGKQAIEEEKLSTPTIIEAELVPQSPSKVERAIQEMNPHDH